MDIEFNYDGPEDDQWIRLPKTILHSSTTNLQHHISTSKPGGRIFIRSHTQNLKGEKKQWTISIPSEEPIVISTPVSATSQKVKLVYFCNCQVSSLYPKIVKHHLKDLRRSGMDKYKNFSAIFVICGTHKDVKAIKRIINRILPNLCNDTIKNTNELKRNRLEIRLFESSHFEYQGIRTFWSESMSSHNDDILAYAHCKSLSRIDDMQEIPHLSKACSEIILGNLDIIASLLTTFGSIERAGICQGGNGWMWHNFFAAKASYLKTRPEPVLSRNRYYYESWLAGRSRYEENYEAPNKNKGLSILTPHGMAIGHLSDAEECNRLICNYKLKTSTP